MAPPLAIRLVENSIACEPLRQTWSSIFSRNPYFANLECQFNVKKAKFCELRAKLGHLRSINGSRVMLFSTRRIARGGAICPPLRKPTRTCATGVKIAGVLEVVNLSTKMQFQVDWGIFEEVRPVWNLLKSYIYVPLPTKTSKPESNKCINFLYKSFLFRFFSLKVKFTEN